MMAMILGRVRGALEEQEVGVGGGGTLGQCGGGGLNSWLCICETEEVYDVVRRVFARWNSRCLQRESNVV